MADFDQSAHTHRHHHREQSFSQSEQNVKLNYAFVQNLNYSTTENAILHAFSQWNVTSVEIYSLKK